ncbi:MAG TPA: DNRLRE domain-containing protein, partial [Solirubrobacteraceae bacterium]|nr:DNRLRE domain-containing protein [Solirubrobacteraceae bacterium]
PNTTIVSGPPTFSNSASAEIRFSADEAVDGFECSLDGAAFTACDTPHAVSGLSNHEHALRVRAIDLAGNVDGSPAVHSWTVDTAAPQTTITSAPVTGTTSTSASFAFTASEAGSTFQCSLDGGAFAACTSPRAYSGLTTTAHEFRVRAVDSSGNTDGSPAVHSWTIGSACSGSTATLGANIDSWVLQSSSGQNYGTDSVLKVDTKSGANARGLVRFNLPTVPAGCTVTNARLRLYATSYKTGRTLQALQLGAAWTESAVRWNNQPATTGTAVTTTSGSGYREWNVTAHVQGMYTGANHGWLIRDQTENGNGLDQAFHSREKGSDNPPRLVVTFGAP